MLVASSFIRLPGTHNILGNMYSQAAVQLAVSDVPGVRTRTNKMPGYLPADCHHTYQPRSNNGQDRVRYRSSRPRNYYRLTASLISLESQSSRCSPNQIHAPGQHPDFSCAGAMSNPRFSRRRRMAIAALPGVQYKRSTFKLTRRSN